MKVMWLINFAVPIITEGEGTTANVNEGWISGMLNALTNYNGVHLAICYPQKKSEDIQYDVIANIEYVGYPQTEDAREYDPQLKGKFVQIIEKTAPDIVHLMGTEFPHCYSMVEACIEKKIKQNLVVSIQGLVSIYAQHYLNTLPVNVVYGRTIRDWIKNENQYKAAQKLKNRGKYERQALALIPNVIGRTDWDMACTMQLAPNAHYYHNNEVLRKSFYDGKWCYKNCEKHSIFFSQATTPIKGLHIMLRALPLIKNRYPDVKLYIAGINISAFPAYKISSYGKYLKDLIREQALSENVVFTGPLVEKEMKKRFLASNVFVSSSVIENSPNSVGEAMILGIPCITSDVGGVKNMIKHEEEGFIYQTDAPYMIAYYVDKIFSMKADATLIGEKAREHALQTHDPIINGRELVEIYRKIKNENTEDDA